MSKKDQTYSGGVVNSVSNYRQKYYNMKYGSTKAPGNDAEEIQKMLVEFHAEGTTHKRKEELKHDILMRTFFLFPHFLKANYRLTAELFNDAIQNMSANTLQAIKLFNPNLGYPFSNYLIAYFKDAATKVFKSTNIVSIATLKKAAKDANLSEDDIDIEDNPYIVHGDGDVDVEDSDDDTETEEYMDTPQDIDREMSDEEYIPDDYAPVDEFLTGNIYSNPEYYNHVYDTNSRILRGANHVYGSVVELDDSREYKLAPGTEKEVDVDDRINSKQLLDWLEYAINEAPDLLNDDERFVLIHHYGLFGQPQMKYADIAAIRKKKGRGFACSRISQINTTAVAKLRDYFKDKQIVL